jgi:hypothetical protein
MKLLIAIPSLDFMHVEFVKSLMGLIKSLDEESIDYEVKILSGTLVYLARDEIVSYAIGYEFTHVLWLDSDMVFTDQLFDDLYDTGKDFVCGVFHARRPGHQSCIFRSLTPPERYRWDEYPSVPFLIKGCGMAATLIKTSILLDVKQKYGSCFTPLPYLGEDLSFCKKADELGYEIWCEPCARVGHIGHITIYPEHEGGYLNNLKR